MRGLMKALLSFVADKATHLRKEDGSIDVGNIMMLGIAMIFIAVGFIIYPVILEGTDAINDWTSPSGNTTLDDFTGLESVNGVVPLIVLIGFVSAGVITGFFGVKNMMNKGD